MENEIQTIEVVKQQVAKANDVVSALKVTTPQEYEYAVEIGGKLKKVIKMVTDRKEEITKPMNEALKSARALFKPMEEMLDSAEMELKNKMLAFREEERKIALQKEKERQEELAKAQEALKKNEITPEQEREVRWAIPEVKEIEKTVKSSTGAKATEKTVTEYVVVDKTKIPVHFMEPDMVKIKASFKAGLPVEGVEERTKQVMSF